MAADKSKVDYLRVIRDLGLKEYKPIYVLSGEEPYFIDQVTDYMEEHIIDEMSRSFGQTILYGRDVSMDQVIGLAKGFPMMGDKQLIIVKEAQDMKEWKKSDEMESLEKYLANPTPSTILVMTLKGKKLDGRLKLSKTIAKVGVHLETEKMRDYHMPDWIMEYTRSKGYQISNDAAHLLAEYLGTDLSKVVNEISKLAIILPPGSSITPQVIEQNIGISKDYNVWELQRSLGQKDVLRCNRIIDYFEANPKDNPIQKVIPSLYGYFSKLAIYTSLKDPKEAAQVLGLRNPFAVNEYKEAARNYSPVKLQRIIHYLRETDRKSKGVGNVSASHGDLMKELVFKILH